MYNMISGIEKIFKQDEKLLLKEYISDQIAYKIIEEEADTETLRVAEIKAEYIKANNNH